ncbi:hypothetical protein GCM10027346_10690 [Hymenobacter seoulensis]
MLRSFLTWLSVLTTTVLLAACCGSVACECDDAYADAIGLKFSPSDSATANGFASDDIKNVFLVRIPRDPLQVPRADTVLVTRSRSKAFELPVIINNATPFALASGNKLTQYSYVLYLAPTRSATPTFTYKIDSVQLATTYEGDGCCSCFRNTNKQAFITQNLQSKVLNLTDPAQTNKLVPIVLTRK